MPRRVKSSESSAVRSPKARRVRQSKVTSTPRLRGVLWIQIRSAKALTEAGADLLEQIEACGSLSEGARRLRFAYRRAWLLVDAMNRAWPSPLVVTSIGGRAGGGARLTEAGRRVLHGYRDLQIQFEHFLDLSTLSI